MSATAYLQVLPQPVFHELKEAVNTNRWLDWDQVRPRAFS